MIPVCSACASEEEFLQWAQVRIVAAEREDVGRVSFAAEVHNSHWRNVEAEAFGRTLLLDAQQCQRLGGFPLSSITTTHEPGYEELGGHTVHFKFRKVFYRDADLVEATVVISISRGKGLRVSEVWERVIGEKKG
ncbi:MAG: hypothetical protein ACFCVE_08565 [Phycisphaerae bacterium]